MHRVWMIGNEMLAEGSPNPDDEPGAIIPNPVALWGESAARFLKK
jgi:hypothetical protein